MIPQSHTQKDINGVWGEFRRRALDSNRHADPLHVPSEYAVSFTVDIDANDVCLQTTYEDGTYNTETLDIYEFDEKYLSLLQRLRDRDPDWIFLAYAPSIIVDTRFDGLRQWLTI